MRQLKLTYPEMEQMFRRMVFNVYARNCDDHTKNHSFIMNRKGDWSLSPAYDICFAYNPTNHWVSKHALSINGKREHFLIKDFMTVAELINCRNPEGIIDEIRRNVSRWKEFANTAHVSKDLVDTIQGSLLVDVDD